ncbi:hypothetical protein [Magnetospira sp. QH-2]|nr:hypothetical protein [Magnetospira sp. QH-2]
MRGLTKFLLLLILLLVVGGGVFLVTWDIPAPVKKVEKVIPNDRFQR